MFNDQLFYFLINLQEKIKGLVQIMWMCICVMKELLVDMIIPPVHTGPGAIHSFLFPCTSSAEANTRL